MGLHLLSCCLDAGAGGEAWGGLGSESPGQPPTDRPLADRRVRDSLGIELISYLGGPATLTMTAQGGEIAFGALEAGLEVEYPRQSNRFPLGRMRGRR